MFYSWLSIRNAIVNKEFFLKKFLDPDRNPDSGTLDLDRHQNLIDLSLGHAPPLNHYVRNG